MKTVKKTTAMLVRKAHTKGACIRLMSLSLDEYPQSRLQFKKTTTMLVRKAHAKGACIRLMSLSLDEYPQSRPQVQEDDDAGT